MEPPENPASRPGRGHIETRALHAADHLNPTSALTPPLFQTSTFRLRDTAQGAQFSHAVAPTEYYTRWGNPTTRLFETTLADLEGGERALAFASGMGAISTTLLALLSAGDHLVVGRSIYAGVQELVTGLLRRFGVESTFADASDLGHVERAWRPHTRAILVETPTNPTLEICDLKGLAAFARSRGGLTIVDNTFATPCNQNPLALGVDVVVHAATKAIGGHSDVTAGAVCSSRDIVKRCWDHLKLLGASLSPFEAWLLLRSLKTLALRVERQNRTAQTLAGFLEAAPQVASVHYPGLPSHPAHELAKRQMRGFGGMLSFELRGGLEAARRFAESLRLIHLAVSLGGAETILQHPASMSHGTLSEDELREAGVSPGLLRLSVGLEAAEDLQQDLERALGGLSDSR